MENNLRFSLFYDKEKGIFETTPHKQITFNELVDIYQSDWLRIRTNYLLEAATDEERQERKKELPFITPYGTFTQRNNNSIEHYNSKLIALDIDGVSDAAAKAICFHLGKLPCTLLSTISPRQKGVKALILIADEIELNKHFDTLKHNRNLIATSLGITAWVESLDIAQFVLCQPFFLNSAPLFFHNDNPTALNIKLQEYTPPQIEQKEFTRNVSPLNRVDVYLQKATDNLVEFFASCGAGDRHRNIIRVQSVASWLHYAPHLREGIKQQLLSAVISMYGDLRTAQKNNAIKTFETAFNTPNKANDTIEEIIFNTHKTA